MLEYERTYREGGSIAFDYFVEGDKADCGSVTFDEESGEAIVAERAPGDFGNRYANHLLSEIESKKGDLPDSGCIMWY